MTDMEVIIKNEVKKIVPSFEKLELRATIGDSSYSVEFFPTIDGQKKQCYEMVDNGQLDEDELDAVLRAIAKALRASPEYEGGRPNKFTFSIEC